MSKHKRINPNKIPIAKCSLDIDQLLTEITQHNVYRSWVIVLGAFADYYATTTEQLFHLWKIVNDYSAKIGTYEDVSSDLEVVDQVLDRTLPHKHLSTQGIKTQGDLDKLTRKLHQNAFYAGICLIAYPLIREKSFSEEYIKELVDRAYSHEEAISAKRYTLDDLVQNLENEYNLLIIPEGNKVYLRGKDAPSVSGL